MGSFVLFRLKAEIRPNANKFGHQFTEMEKDAGYKRFTFSRSCFHFCINLTYVFKGLSQVSQKKPRGLDCVCIVFALFSIILSSARGVLGKLGIFSRHSPMLHTLYNGGPLTSNKI